MEPAESPRVEQVGGILSRGEDTDGERTDDEVDFPSESSYVSQHHDRAEGFKDEGEQQKDSDEELEVTGEGTAGGPFGLKKVLFVRKKSEKGVGSKEEPSFKDRFNKLGAGVGERFAAFGNIIHEHGSKSAAATGSPTSRAAEKFSAPDATSEPAHVAPQGGAPAGPATSEQPQQQAMEYFQEYEVTFTTKPKFSLVEGADGRGAVVSWDAGTAPPSADGGGAPAPVPPSGAAVIAVSGESVAEKKLAEVLELLESASKDLGTGREEGQAKDNGDKLSVEVPADPVGGGSGGGGLVVRFREKMKPQHETETGSAGGEVFRNKMKAMATGIGNLFQAKEPASSAVRDGSSVSAGGGGPSAAAAAAVPDAFPLTFSAGSGTVEDLPFTMADVVGGLGVIVAAVGDDYAEHLIVAEEAGVVSAGTAGVAAGGGGGGEEGGGGRSNGPDGEEGVLVPGALILRVAGQNVEGKGMGRVRKVLETAAVEHSAVKILFRRAPPIYRASVAAELALEQSKVPQVHVGTWQPLLKRRAGVTLSGDGENGGGGGGGGGIIGLGYGGEEWEDVQATMARAHRFVNGFRSVGIRVDVLSMQTVALPRNVKSAYAGTFEGRPSSFQQAARLWFSFPGERTVTLQRQATLEKLGLLHVETRGGGGAIGAWVTITAADASPCAAAGVPVGESSLLTHVNGFDVSPPAYRSLAPRAFGDGEGWAAAVLPALESGRDDSITLSFV